MPHTVIMSSYPAYSALEMAVLDGDSIEDGVVDKHLEDLVVDGQADSTGKEVASEFGVAGFGLVPGWESKRSDNSARRAKTKRRSSKKSYNGPLLDNDLDQSESDEYDAARDAVSGSDYPAYSDVDDSLGASRSARRRAPYCTPTVMLGSMIVIAISLAFAGVMIALSDSDVEPQKPQNRLKVFVMAGQTNMAGYGSVDNRDEYGNYKKGTLNYILDNLGDYNTDIYKTWDADANKSAERDDVWIWMDRSDEDMSPENASFGLLTVGYGDIDRHTHIGPELGFGDVIGDSYDEQVLIIKTAWRGKSLSASFLPPSAMGGPGPSYTEMIHDINYVLNEANLNKMFPAYSSMEGYDIAGFVWYQGWTDGRTNFSNGALYEENLVSLVGDVRRELGVPSLPVSVILSSAYGWEFERHFAQSHYPILQAQQRVANTTLHPSMNPITTVDSRSYWHDCAESPVPNEPHHMCGNAETFWELGKAAGEAMRTLLV